MNVESLEWRQAAADPRPSPQLVSTHASVLAATGKPQLVFCFKNFAKENVSVDSAYQKLLDQVYWGYLKM